MAALGYAVRQIRREKQLTQVEVGERAGMHVTYLSGVERGSRNPTWLVIHNIAYALGVKPAELVRRAEEIWRAEEEE